MTDWQKDWQIRRRGELREFFNFLHNIGCLQRRTQRGKFESAGRGMRRENSRGQAIKVEIHQLREAGMERRIILQLLHRHEPVCLRYRAVHLVMEAACRDLHHSHGAFSFLSYFVASCATEAERCSVLSWLTRLRLPCSLPSVSVPVDVIVQLSVSANSHVNGMRCSMFSSHASSASLDGSWRSLNLSVTTGRAAARHQKIWASLTQITEAVIKLCFCTVTLCVLLSYTSMFVQIK